MADADGSVTLDSQVEEVVLMCQPCADDGQQLPAEGYCVDCGEHLCNRCFLAHTIPRIWRCHVLKNKNEMPTSYTKSKTSGLKEEKCQLHSNEDITSFCKSHDRLCCERCVLIGHRSCKDVLPVGDLAKDIKENKTFKGFVERVTKLGRLSEAQNKKADTNIQRIDMYYNTCVDDFSAAVGKIKLNDLTNTRAVQSVSKSVLQQLKLWEANIENKNDTQLFILMKLFEKDLKLMEENSGTVGKENKFENYCFVSVEDPAMLGKVMRCPYMVKKMSIKHSSETKTCYSRGIQLLDENHMLVTDSSNKSIKLVDLAQHKILSHKVLPQEPWEMTLTDNKQVYVCLRGQNKILHLKSPLPDLNDIAEYPVDGKCATVKYTNDSLLVAFMDPIKFFELDLNCKAKRTIDVEFPDKCLTSPQHSALNAAADAVIYSDCFNNSLTEVSNDGKTKLVVQSEEIKGTDDLSADIDGSYIVCSYSEKRIVRLEDTGEITSLISDLGFSPSAIALDKENRLLYVGGLIDTVNVYKI